MKKWEKPELEELNVRETNADGKKTFFMSDDFEIAAKAGLSAVRS